jgi:hypothetical protein
MREVFASINYVINKLEEKNLFKIAQEGHDIFAAIYRFVGDGEGGLNRADDDKNDQYYESTAPSNMFENDLYNPLEKTRQTKWRVKSEVPSDYSKPSATEAPSSPFNTEAPSAESTSTNTENPSTGPTTHTTSGPTTFTMPSPETSTVTITAPSYSNRTEGTSSGASSSSDNIIDLKPYHIDEGIPLLNSKSEESNSGTSSYEPTSTGLFGESSNPRLLEERSIYDREENDQNYTNEEKMAKLVFKKLLRKDYGILSNPTVIKMAKDADSGLVDQLAFNGYYLIIPEGDVINLGVSTDRNTYLNKQQVLHKAKGRSPASAKQVLSMTNTFITNLENFGLKREADAMHDVFVKIANAYDLVNRPGVSVQAKKWIQDNVANIDAMTNLQLVNMMASLPLNVQTELKQIITQYKSTQGYKQNKPMGYQQPNQQGYQQPYQQGYQQGYQQQNMYGNQGGMVRPQ